ncbi:hypothetical protein JTB14_026844 [Gonioctena quinquepunctata]|nr:hypothetical protein JTB14_026844 [Gonioctena quinquepunctata]
MSFKEIGRVSMSSSESSGTSWSFLLSQPQLSASPLGFPPKHRCTWWYVRNQCCLTAPSVGGRVVRSGPMLAAALINDLQRDSLRDFSVAEAPYHEGVLMIPAVTMKSGETQTFANISAARCIILDFW